MQFYFNSLLFSLFLFLFSIHKVASQEKETQQQQQQLSFNVSQTTPIINQSYKISGQNISAPIYITWPSQPFNSTDINSLDNQTELFIDVRISEISPLWGQQHLLCVNHDQIAQIFKLDSTSSNMIVQSDICDYYSLRINEGHYQLKLNSSDFSKYNTLYISFFDIASVQYGVHYIFNEETSKTSNEEQEFEIILQEGTWNATQFNLKAQYAYELISISMGIQKIKDRYVTCNGRDTLEQHKMFLKQQSIQKQQQQIKDQQQKDQQQPQKQFLLNDEKNSSNLSSQQEQQHQQSQEQQLQKPLEQPQYSQCLCDKGYAGYQCELTVKEINSQSVSTVEISPHHLQVFRITLDDFYEMLIDFSGTISFNYFFCSSSELERTIQDSIIQTFYQPSPLIPLRSYTLSLKLIYEQSASMFVFWFFNEGDLPLKIALSFQRFDTNFLEQFAVVLVNYVFFTFVGGFLICGCSLGTIFCATKIRQVFLVISRKNQLEKQLPLMRYDKYLSNPNLNRNSQSTQTVCPVCLGDFVDQEKVRVTQCLHVFHNECIHSWALQKSQCPICREQLFEEGNGREQDGRRLNSNDENRDHRNQGDISNIHQEIVVEHESAEHPAEGGSQVPRQLLGNAHHYDQLVEMSEH